MKQTVYCALDLESTGLEPKQDAITEVGAVLFTLSQNGKLEFLEEFSQLVKPPIPIPEFIQDLTRIRPQDIENAPSWDEVRGKVKKFIGNYIIVGQNIQFDLALLAANNLEFKQAFIDTRELASIFVPEARFYNLEYLMRFFQMPLRSHHRALEDAKSSARLLQRLVLSFKNRPYVIQKQATQLLKASTLSYRSLFATGKLSSRLSKVVDSSNDKPLLVANKTITKSGHHSELLTHLVTDETAEGHLDWTKLFSLSNTVFVDLGLLEFSVKGLSSLSQAMLHQPGAAVLSVGTEQEFLQVQSLVKDDAAVVLDEPQNYICAQRLNCLLNHKRPSDTLVKFLIKLLIWKHVNPNARLNRLPLFGPEYTLINLVAGNFKDCAAHREGEACELFSVLSRLRRASKIFTKHAAWFKLVHAGQALQPRKLGVFWGLEQLEQVLLFKTGRVVSLKDLRVLVSTIYNPEDGSGMIDNLDVASKKQWEQALNSLDLTFGLWSIILTQELLVTAQRVCDNVLRESEAFNKMRLTSENLAGRLEALIQTLPPQTLSDMSVKQIVENLKEVIIFLKEFFSAPMANTVYWFDIFDGRLKLKSQILTSSLDSLGNFDCRALLGLVLVDSVKHYYRRIFNIVEAETVSQSRVKPPLTLMVASNLSAKETPNSHKQLVTVLEQLLPKLSGRSLVLFNSQKLLEHVFLALPRHAFLDRLLVQKYTGHQWKNLENFEKLPQAIWFLTVNNFLKNIHTLPPVENLLLARLPYDAPGVLSEAFEPEEIFDNYVLPKTAIRLMAILQRLFGDLTKADNRRQFFVLDSRLSFEHNAALMGVFYALCEVTEQDWQAYSQDEAK